ncbi:peroxiredoxin [Microlunatus capsulatus]|uniref:Peroxiredoxin n=1 Tax=Microlunatus capsulatus TaxID=99117 RepID=A0ABS4Z480_9ACTN|nr:peroxiredoxin [Microlunatus capsulatus]MBP2415852.1 peroxiredoxin [Microlunatus capsulatus]
MSAGVPQAGQTAPDFTARNQHGQEVTRASLLGAPAVLVFYPFAFSGICTSELCALRDDLAQFTAVDARVLAISCDPMFALRAFADAQGLTFDLLADHWPHGRIAQDYGVFDEEHGVARRGSFVLDAEGTVTWSVLTGLGEARSIAEHLQALPAA